MVSVLDRIIENHLASGGTIITLLQETQDSFGYIPKEAVSYLSDQLSIAPSRFYGVATFYAQFRLTPPGKNMITACSGTACHVRGAERIVNGLRRELKLAEEDDTTADAQFTLEKVACLGFCSFAPVVLINGTVFGKTTAEGTVKEIKSLRKK